MRSRIKFIDLFCGIGGFHYAIDRACRNRGLEAQCVLASDIDEACQEAYVENFGVQPEGDVSRVKATAIPKHDILLAGFPCQPFSIIGDMLGFEDTRGTLFFEIARILDAKKPAAFILENVKMLVGHRQGKTLARIQETLQNLGYFTSYRVLNALDFGLPQKRERIFIVGFRKPTGFLWPEGGVPMTPLSAILEKNVPKKYIASEHIRAARQVFHKPGKEPTIWHENKAGNVSKYPYSCALRAGASYNYLLVDGKRRLTEREMLRLQGFPESYKIVTTYSETRKQAGNALPIPVAAAVIERVLDAMGTPALTPAYKRSAGQMEMVLERGRRR